MRHIILITLNTPTEENVRGASALPYHLLIERPEDTNVTIFSFNANEIAKHKIKEIEECLYVEIRCIPMPIWIRWIQRILFIRIFLRLPYLCYIKLSENVVHDVKKFNPDIIWIYGEELTGIVKQFSEFKRVHLGPDTESLYYYRMIGQRFVMSNALDYWKCALMYRKYARMERNFPSDDNYTYYAVGEEDVRHLQQLNPEVRAKFLRHPHYKVSQHTTIINESQNNYGLANDVKARRFHQPKIKLLIAGQNNLYMREAVDLLNSQISIHNSQLKDSYIITFLGKGWERHAETLKKAGFEVEHISYAPDYIDEICQHDIQITPIAIGTGTKGKVLDAIANGLLVIGTPYALENITVQSGVSCIEYNQPQEVIEILKAIPKNRKKYETMAFYGREAILKSHDRHNLSQELFS